MSRFNLAWRLLRRESRSGELTLLMLALTIAVTSTSAITLFTERLQRTMTLQAAEFLAGDMVIESITPPPQEWQDKARQLGLMNSQTTEFSSVLVEHEQLILSGIKSVSKTYPLRGYLKTATDDYADEQISLQGPEAGTTWVEKRILSTLNLKLFDPLNVGEKTFTISKIITYEPDKRGDFYSFSPRVLINSADLPATNVIQPGSHVHYFFQLSGENAGLAAFKQWLKPQLNSSQRLLDIHEDRPELGSALSRTERYLGLSGIVVTLIAGVAIAMATRRYTERHFSTAALLRCLGCKQPDILLLFCNQFLFLGLISSGIGSLFGLLSQQGLFYLLKPLLPEHIAAASPLAFVISITIGMTVLLGFALPPLLRLKQVSPLRVLRRELDPLPSSAWFVYGLALTLISALVWRYTGDLGMTATVVLGSLSALLVIAAFLYGLMSLLHRVSQNTGLSWRFALQNMLRNKPASIGQILAFSITITAMQLSLTVRNDLLDNWQKQLPEHAPNHFVLNIFPNQQANFQQDLVDQHIHGSQFYPVVRGRLTAINAIPVQKLVSKDSQGERATHRELSLTFTEQLPQDNVLTAGHWWQATEAGLVSVEQKLAENLNIHLQDQLTFTIGSEEIQAKVASIRSLHWDTMKPNFYMIFSPGTLDQFPGTYLISFYLPGTQKNFLNSLVKKYPSITVLEVDRILQQFKTMLKQLTLTIDYLLYFALLAGFTVLWAAVYASLDDRIFESAIMRSLGAKRSFLNTLHIIEFALLGFISGLLANIIMEIILYVLYTHFMGMTYQPSYYLWLATPLTSTIVVCIAGYWRTLSVLNKSPLQILRQQ